MTRKTMHRKWECSRNAILQRRRGVGEREGKSFGEERVGEKSRRKETWGKRIKGCLVTSQRHNHLSKWQFPLSKQDTQRCERLREPDDTRQEKEKADSEERERETSTWKGKSAGFREMIGGNSL